ncbi:MAG: hypothetical protein IKC09_03570, partial [Oscillospiraceae bacterium]|nr:hypothetical protein [Oscillospiraceae bacterium]
MAIRSPKYFIFAESAPETAGFRGCGLPRRRLLGGSSNDILFRYFFDRLSKNLSLRTSAHTGVAIRSPKCFIFA